MAQRIETITQHVFAFDDEEITRILNALYDFGDEELADAIHDEMACDCEECEIASGEFGNENDDVEELIDAIRKFTGGE